MRGVPIKWNSEEEKRLYYNEQRRLWKLRPENKERIAAKNKAYRYKNKDKLKKYREDNKDKLKDYRDGRKDLKAIQDKEYAKKNRDILNKKMIIRKKENPSFRISCNLRERVRGELFKVSVKKNESFSSLLGCSIKEAKRHIESQFKDGMNWDNYGKKGWHIDHIKPCASFDLTKTSQQKKCFNYKNLQPLWATENHSKGCRYGDYNNTVYPIDYAKKHNLAKSTVYKYIKQGKLKTRLSDSNKIMIIQE